MFMSNLIPLSSGSTGGLGGSSLYMLIMIVAVFLFMYFIALRPQKKKEKKEAAMRANLQVGDEVVTIGGIIGIVFSIKEDTVVIETGSDRSKIRVTKTAIFENKTVHELEAEIKSKEEKPKKKSKDELE